MHKRQRETVAFDAVFLKRWRTFCAERGYVRRQAAHACRLAFMSVLTPQQREEVMEHVEVMEHPVRSARGAGGANGARVAVAKSPRAKRAGQAR